MNIIGNGGVLVVFIRAAFIKLHVGGPEYTFGGASIDQKGDCSVCVGYNVMK